MDTYEKKYNEAQKWIESIYSELSHEQQMEAEAFFPELKESEDVDKKIREEIIATIHLYYGKPLEDEAKEMIAWLEKQGEQKPVIEIKSAEESLGISSEEYNDIVNDCLYGESKTAEKVEPKFHKGDWVVTSYGKVNQVIAVDEDGDGFTLDDDTYFSGSWKDGYHLWTIQDAKDGDVLASNRSIFIFSQEYIAGKPEAHCGIMNGLFLAKPEGCWTNEECYPATKEQRNILFAKMKEAGYEWDTEKKELKKISQRMVSAEAKEALYDKPAWSEEDETGWTNTMIMIKEVASNHYTKDSIKLVIDWLKSLKDRYTWKPSDEQMEALAWALSLAKNCGEEMAFDLRTLYEQLKKLKGE